MVDVSQWQGTIDFAVMRERGVAGIIFRATHGRTPDERVGEYVTGARAAGYTDDDLGFYSFLNPKRGPARASAATTVDVIRRALGHTDTFYMIDVEDYAPFTPRRGRAGTYGAAYARWIRRHVAEARRLAPDMRVIGYTNAAYWDGPVPGAPAGTRWVGDDDLAGQLEWIVPRYPVWPPRGADDDAIADWVKSSPKPPKPARWAAWAQRIAPDGPAPPGGASWAGWQFSAGYNRQGRRYGCSSDDLDLDIVRTEAWKRWTRSARRAPVRRRTTTVRAGEGWYHIARRTLGNASRWPEIADLNGGRDRVLHPGDTVRLP